MATSRIELDVEDRKLLFILKAAEGCSGREIGKS